MSSHSG